MIFLFSGHFGVYNEWVKWKTDYSNWKKGSENEYDGNTGQSG